MKTTYLKIFVDVLEKCRKLSDAEFGRLMRAALTYKETGGEVELNGREGLLWDGIKMDIDKTNDAYLSKVRSDSGKQGASARWQKMANAINPMANDGKNGKCQQEKEKEKEKKRDTNVSPKESVSAVFDSFWEAYPRKVGKAAARRAFEAALKRESIVVMLDALDWQRVSWQWTRDGGQYIPHPTTWLNRDGWLDEPQQEPPRREPKNHLPTQSAQIDFGGFDPNAAQNTGGQK